MAEATLIPRLYLDVCCVNRLFDDQRQDRIRLEAEAEQLFERRTDRQLWRADDAPTA